MLWLPIKRLLQYTQEIRREKGVEKYKVPGLSPDSRAFLDTVSKLATTLRELHNIERRAREVPLILDTPVGLRGYQPSPSDKESLEFGQEVFEMTPLFLDLAFVYLRRLAYFLTATSRPVLFEKYGEAPQHYKELVERVNDRDKVNALKPICNPDLLQQALNDHSSWFASLTAREQTGKGLRDAMEHRLSFVVATRQQSGGNPPRLSVQLYSRAHDVGIQPDLTSTLRDIVKDMCELWTGLHAAVGWANEYDSRDALVLIGDDDDATGFWPEI